MNYKQMVIYDKQMISKHTNLAAKFSVITEIIFYRTPESTVRIIIANTTRSPLSYIVKTDMYKLI